MTDVYTYFYTINTNAKDKTEEYLLDFNEIAEFDKAFDFLSLIYYFLCGGVPLLVSMAMNKINYAYEGHYYRVIIAFISVYLIASALTWLIVRYIPQITGKR